MSRVVLCIDDRQEILARRKQNLELVGYSVLTAESGVAGMMILKETAIDAVLIEYRQEGIDTEATAFHIKHFFPRVPIILLSAFSHMPERILWLVDEYVMKSVTSEELDRTIGRVTPKRPVRSTAEVFTALFA